VRRLFPIDRDYIHMAGMLITSHPGAVAESVAEHRRGLDRNPAEYVEDRNRDLEAATRSAAASYLGARAGDVALTESTTMGIALVYNGIALRSDQEMLTTTHDYYSTRESLRYRAARTGATVRTIEPFADSRTATADEVADRIIGAVGPRTRVLALTWVHSWTGIRIPVRQIAERLAEVNAGRGPEDRVLFGLDGVHALGVEDFEVPELGCDFFMAGTHKWLFGPRGTGVLWGRPETQDAVTPTIPTFSAETGWGGRMTPGGFKAFEHTWSLRHAFELHGELGKARVTERIHELNRQCREGLAAMDHVTLHTPREPALASGIVSFDVDGLSAEGVVSRLADRSIIASVTPYDVPHARLSPGLLNDPAEVDATLEAIRDLA
jgi:isopenicillin-N epimerase